MQKILNHFKNNAIIYLIIITCIIVLIVVRTKTGMQLPEDVRIDTSHFNVVDIDNAVKLFEDSSPKMLIVSVYNCPATERYVPVVRVSQIKYQYTSYYLELTDIKEESESYKKFEEELDKFDYTYEGKKGTLKTFLGNTPLTLFIKDNRVVYGYYGTMSENVLNTFIEKYGVGNNE